MGTDLVLPSDLKAKVDEILKELQRKTYASCVMLCDLGGQLICKTGALQGLDATTFAALTAGDVAATTEMASMLGEQKPFRLLFHEGERQSVYVSCVFRTFLLAVVFRAAVKIGLVRLYTEYAVRDLIPLAQQFETLQAEYAEELGSEFASAVGPELQGLFRPPAQ
jgi:predicted regulator of Ras-like GTPase activity (Roadblock/LC7/MglB family)